MSHCTTRSYLWLPSGFTKEILMHMVSMCPRTLDSIICQRHCNQLTPLSRKVHRYICCKARGQNGRAVLENVLFSSASSGDEIQSLLYADMEAWRKSSNEWSSVPPYSTESNLLWDFSSPWIYIQNHLHNKRSLRGIKSSCWEQRCSKLFDLFHFFAVPGYLTVTILFWNLISKYQPVFITEITHDSLWVFAYLAFVIGVCE